MIATIPGGAGNDVRRNDQHFGAAAAHLWANWAGGTPTVAMDESLDDWARGGLAHERPVEPHDGRKGGKGVYDRRRDDGRKGKDLLRKGGGGQGYGVTIRPKCHYCFQCVFDRRMSVWDPDNDERIICMRCLMERWRDRAMDMTARFNELREQRARAAGPPPLPAAVQQQPGLRPDDRAAAAVQPPGPPTIAPPPPPPDDRAPAAVPSPIAAALQQMASEVRANEDQSLPSAPEPPVPMPLEPSLIPPMPSRRPPIPLAGPFRRTSTGVAIYWL